MQSKQARAWLPGFQVSCVGAHQLSSFLLFFEDNFEVCKSSKWVFRVKVIVADLFQN